VVQREGPIPAPSSLPCRAELERIIRERLDEGNAELGELILSLQEEKTD
jgi:hypothetical protein